MAERPPVIYELWPQTVESLLEALVGMAERKRVLGEPLPREECVFATEAAMTDLCQRLLRLEDATRG